MTQLDASLFADVADALGISSPSIAEKDYYAIQLLNLLSQLTSDHYDFVFSGGTCLAKAHKNTYRMSEDVDIELIPKPDTQQLTISEQKRLRRAVSTDILVLIKDSSLFQLENIKKRNEGKYQQYLIEYPKSHHDTDALRPHIQLDVTESTLLQPPIDCSLSSLYAQVAGIEPEVKSFSCVTMESTASEKFVSLLRRTAAHD